MWQLYWTCHIFLPISPRCPEKHELKVSLFPILFFLSDIQSTEYSPKTSKSILAVLLQEHFPLQVYFWLSFTNQRMVVISSYLKMWVLPHRTQKRLKKSPEGLLSSLRLQLCYTVQLRTSSVLWHKTGNPELNRISVWAYLNSHHTFCSLCRDELHYSDLPTKKCTGKRNLQASSGHTHKLFHKEEFFQPCPIKLRARSAHPH